MTLLDAGQVNFYLSQRIKHYFILLKIKRMNQMQFDKFEKKDYCMICLFQETGKKDTFLKQLRDICQFFFTFFSWQRKWNADIVLFLISSYICLKHLISILRMGTSDHKWWLFEESVCQAKTTWLYTLVPILFCTDYFHTGIDVPSQNIDIRSILGAFLGNCFLFAHIFCFIFQPGV